MLGVPEADEQRRVRLDQRDPRRRRPRVRRLVRRPRQRRHVDVRLRPGARPGPPRQPEGRPRLGADAGRRRRPAADARRVRLVLHPPRRRRQRDDPQRHQLGHEAAHRPPRPERLWMDDFDARTPDAIEEIVRWASPVIHMRRTAIEDTRIGDQEIAAGDKVVMWYWSANRDETVFADAHRFDITRPNAKAQVGYGGGGPHFCLGANLARREITMMFRRSSTGCPTSRSPASRPACCARSSTASSGWTAASRRPRSRPTDEPRLGPDPGCTCDQDPDQDDRPRYVAAMSDEPEQHRPRRSTRCR